MRISPPARSQILHPPGARRGVQVQRCATQPAVSKRHRLACDMGGLSILSGSRDRRMASIGSAATPRERSSLLARSRSLDTDEVPITHCTASSHAHFVLSFYHLSTSVFDYRGRSGIEEAAGACMEALSQDMQMGTFFGVFCWCCQTCSGAGRSFNVCGCTPSDSFHALSTGAAAHQPHPWPPRLHSVAARAAFRPGRAC